MLAIACAWMALGQSKIPERLTYGQLRALVPVELRPVQGDAAAWNLLGQIRKAVVEPPQTTHDPKPLTQVKDLIAEWHGTHGADLVRRSKERLSPEAPRLELVERALKAGPWGGSPWPDEKYPEFTDLALDDMGVLRSVRNATELYTLRAFVAAGEGDGSEVVRSLRTARAIGQRLSEGGGTVINYLVAFTCLSMADDDARRLANHPALTFTQRAGLARSITSFDYLKAMRNSYVGEFDRMILAFVGSIPTLSLFQTNRPAWAVTLLRGHPEPFDMRATVREAAEVWLAQLAKMSHPGQVTPDPRKLLLAYCSSVPATLRGQVWDSPRPPKGFSPQEAHRRLMKVPNPLGRAYLYSLGESVVLDDPEMAFLTAAKKNEATQMLTSLVLAADAYHLRTGSWPAKLSDLGPKDGVDKALLDPFSNKPFHFDPGHLLVWSVGPKGKADRKDGLTISLETGVISK